MLTCDILYHLLVFLIYSFSINDIFWFLTYSHSYIKVSSTPESYFFIIQYIGINIQYIYTLPLNLYIFKSKFKIFPLKSCTNTHLHFLDFLILQKYQQLLSNLSALFRNYVISFDKKKQKRIYLLVKMKYYKCTIIYLINTICILIMNHNKSY